MMLALFPAGNDTGSRAANANRTGQNEKVYIRKLDFISKGKPRKAIYDGWNGFPFYLIYVRM